MTFHYLNLTSSIIQKIYKSFNVRFGIRCGYVLSGSANKPISPQGKTEIIFVSKFDYGPVIGINMNLLEKLFTNLDFFYGLGEIKIEKPVAYFYIVRDGVYFQNISFSLTVSYFII